MATTLYPVPSRVDMIQAVRVASDEAAGAGSTLLARYYEDHPELLNVAHDTVALNRWDRAGMLVSGACAVHCTILPLLVAAMPVLGLGRLFDDEVEWFFVVATGAIGVTAHLRGYLRDHRHVAPGLIFAAGFSFVLVARLFFESHRIGPYAVGLGGVLAAASHWANLRLCRCCEHSDHPNS